MPYLNQKGQFQRLFEFKNTWHLEINKIQSGRNCWIGSDFILFPKIIYAQNYNMVLRSTCCHLQGYYSYPGSSKHWKFPHTLIWGNYTNNGKWFTASVKNIFFVCNQIKLLTPYSAKIFLNLKTLTRNYKKYTFCHFIGTIKRPITDHPFCSHPSVQC